MTTTGASSPRILYIVALGLILPGCSPGDTRQPSPAAPPSFREIYELGARVTWKILVNADWRQEKWRVTEARYGAGIGFRKDGWILTSAHVVNRGTISVVSPDGVGHVADRWYVDDLIDVGVVHVPNVEIEVPRFADSEEGV